MPRWIALATAGLLLGVAAIAWNRDRAQDIAAAPPPPPSRMAALAAPVAEAPDPAGDTARAYDAEPLPRLLPEPEEELLRAPRARPADARTAEEKRFARYDRNDDRAISQAEYLYLRRNNFRRLDRDGDGRLSFEEYAAEGIVKFARADRDNSGRLDAREFATTAVRRRAAPDCDAPATRERAPARAGREPARPSPAELPEDA